MEEGNFYHIYNRGINKANIFFEPRNYDYFLKKFNHYLFDYLDLYSYCLLPNHFHFLVKVKEKVYKSDNQKKKSIKPSYLLPIEKAFRDYFICYSKTINNEYARTGALFQYKFKRKVIKSEDYLTSIMAYIHLNPVRAGLCEKPEDWKYSSYNAFITYKPSKLKRQEVLSWFGGKEDFIEYHNNYKDFQRETYFIFKQK